jgi:large subunit ribosomal protein L24
MKIKTGDNVKAISGADRGKTGKVIQVFPKLRKVVVDKLNMRSRHLRANGKNKGQKVEYAAPLAAANVMLICPKCQKPTRVGQAALADGKKVRVCKHCKEQFS